MARHADTILESRWKLTLHGAETLADDLGGIGCWVGPRTGPDRRTHGQKEDYVLRRLLAAWRQTDQLVFPVEVRSARDAKGQPDFILEWMNGRTLGIEVTEAGSKTHQRWMTLLERSPEPAQLLPEEPVPSSEEVAGEIAGAIEAKVAVHKAGAYREPLACDLVVYDNTAWGGFLDKREIASFLDKRRDLAGSFRQVHIVFGDFVQLDLFGNQREWVDVRNTYEIDYAAWIEDQVERLRKGALSGVDAAHVAEELADLGRSERHRAESHLTLLLMHLIKWQFQPKKRSKSWHLTIRNSRRAVERTIAESPSLRRYVGSYLATAYADARADAVVETSLKPAAIPSVCPYSVEQLVDFDFMPE